MISNESSRVNYQEVTDLKLVVAYLAKGGQITNMKRNLNKPDRISFLLKKTKELSEIMHDYEYGNIFVSPAKYFSVKRQLAKILK